MPAVPSLDTKPLYALAGAGDAAVTALRTRVVALPSLVQALPAQVKELPTQVKELPTQVKELRDTWRQQVAELATKAEQKYDDFAAQGEKAVAARRGETKSATKPATKPASKPATKRAVKPAAAKAPVATKTP